MSAATRATTARQRATIALEMLVKVQEGKCRNLSRAYDDCFEMNDGDAVVACGLESLRRSLRYREAVSGLGSYWAPVVWVERAKALAEGERGEDDRAAHAYLERLAAREQEKEGA